MVIAGLPNADSAGAVTMLIFVIMFAMCGVLAGPNDLPGFWVWVYRANPLTYVVNGLLGSTLANAPVVCSASEILNFAPPNGSTCEEYMTGFIDAAGGYLIESSRESTSECRFCPMDSTNTFLKMINIDFDKRWQDFGYLWVYVVFNIAAAVFFYWLARVPKGKKFAKK